MSDGPKILVLDIETSPNLAHVWGLFKQNISLAQLRDSTQVISFGAGWADKTGVEFRSDFHDGHDEMVHRAHELLDEADIVVHYNGERFDIPHLNREFWGLRLDPPSPYKQVDLLKTMRRVFKFPSNKLDYVSRFAGLEGKYHHSGFDLWLRCLAGDPKAWSEMRRYNKQDVVTTRDLYWEALPWISGHPHVGLYLDDPAGVDRCQNCGSEDLRRKGYARTDLGKFQQYQCRACGKWSRSKRRIAGVELRAAN